MSLQHLASKHELGEANAPRAEKRTHSGAYDVIKAVHDPRNQDDER